MAATNRMVRIRDRSGGHCQTGWEDWEDNGNNELPWKQRSARGSSSMPYTLSFEMFSS